MLPDPPPGLTCCVCLGPLYPEDARRTERGWRHSGPPQECQTRKREARNEDLRWMAETGESYSGAARRLGVTIAALERHFRLHPMPEVRAALVSRDPIGWHEEQRRRQRERRSA